MEFEIGAYCNFIENENEEATVKIWGSRKNGLKNEFYIHFLGPRYKECIWVAPEKLTLLDSQREQCIHKIVVLSGPRTTQVKRAERLVSAPNKIRERSPQPASIHNRVTRSTSVLGELDRNLNNIPAMIKK